jgi:hypothetical protein
MMREKMWGKKKKMGFSGLALEMCCPLISFDELLLRACQNSLLY